jgi:hypothetical protein
MARLRGRLIRRPRAAYSYLPATRSGARMSTLSLVMEAGGGDGDLPEKHKREMIGPDQARCRRG